MIYVFAGLSIALVLWWCVARSTAKYPPLLVAEDDPRMMRAVEKAVATKSIGTGSKPGAK